MYLWHWPLISMARIVISKPPSTVYCVCAFVACTVLAWLTTRLIENPLRFGEYGKAKTIGLFLTMMALGGTGYVLFIKQGIPIRWESQKQIDEKSKISKLVEESQKKCKAVFPEWEKKTNPCYFQNKEGRNTIALVGDSHVGHLFPGLIQVTKEGEGIVVFPASCATPFIDIISATKNNPRRQNNWQLHREAYKYIFEHPEIKTVVLGHHPQCSFYDVIDRQNPKEKDRNRIMENGMRRTFDILKEKGKKVLVVLDNPSLNFEPQSCIARPFVKPARGVFRKDIHSKEKSVTSYNERIINISKEYPNISIIDLSEYLCDSKNCYAVKNKKLLYKDRNHFNYDGSLYVAPAIMEKIREISK